jgi:hypothetical protein
MVLEGVVEDRSAREGASHDAPHVEEPEPAIAFRRGTNVTDDDLTAAAQTARDLLSGLI